MKDSFTFRLRLVYVALFAVCLVLIGRLFMIQVVSGSYYEKEANKQYQSLSSNYLDRGEIFFKDKDGKLFSAASIKKGYLVAIAPKKIKDVEGVYQKLAGVFEVDKTLFFKAAGKKDDTYEEIAHKLEKEQGEKIAELKLEGVEVHPESWRVYPSDTLAAHVVGFMGYSETGFAGRYGIEKQYEKTLQGEVNSPKVDSFAQFFADIKETVDAGGASKGSVVLTIDPIIQTTLEKEMDKLVEKYTPKGVGAIIIEPKTGKILAMGSKPDFNPNSYGKTESISYFNNPAVQNIYEMGSIMKPLTLAGAIDMGAITANTKYEDKGSTTLNGKTFSNFDGLARGWVDMQEIINQSLNTGSAWVALKMGKENFRKYMVSYGFGEKTEIDLPEEVRGKISNILESPRDIEYATAAFGQGVAVTPIEMAVALSALANGGSIMKPFMVEEIDYEGGLEVKKITEVIEKRKVFKKETADEMSRMLVKMVDTALLKGKYKLEHYSVAAKTGTAQKKSNVEKGYEGGGYLHSFFGYAPAYDAKFLILFYLDDPVGAKYSSDTLSEPFMNMTNYLINYYNIPPDR